MQTVLEPIGRVQSSRLIYEMSSRPHEAYCEASRRGADICERPERWKGKRAAQATQECEQLRRVVRAYYELRGWIGRGSAAP